MKKKLSVLLALAMALCLSACGSKNVEVGASVSSKDFEITVDSVDFGDALDGVSSKNSVANENYLLPIDGFDGSVYGKIDGKKYLVVTYSLKFIGKKERRLGQNSFGVIKYGDYEIEMGLPEHSFEYDQILYNGKWDNISNIKFQPLDSNVYTVRSYYVMPEDVETNEDMSLSYVIKRGGIKATYKIR